MFNKLHEWLLALPEHYPELIDYTMIDTFFSAARAKILGFGESAVKLSITSLMNLVSLGIYAFLVPLMMFFMLKDKTELLAGVSRFYLKTVFWPLKYGMKCSNKLRIIFMASCWRF